MAALGSNFTYCSEGPFAGSPLTTMKCAPGTAGFSDHLPWSVFQYLALAAAGFAVGLAVCFSCAQAAASRQAAVSHANFFIYPSAICYFPDNFSADIFREIHRRVKPMRSIIGLMQSPAYKKEDPAG